MIDKLIQKIQKTGAPIVVGLDPMLKFVPDHIRKAAFEEKGETLEGAAEAVWLFNKAIVDRICDLIPAVKPQIAMYEQFGIPGLAVFRRTVDYCREKGLVVIGDAKRGDIGSTSAAYAAAHLGRVQVGDSLENGYSYVGAVVGATYPEQGMVLRRVMPRCFILVPGYGAQGATGKDLIHFFDEDRLGAIVNSSRGIIAAYQNEKYSKFGPANFADASRQAVIDMITDIDQAFAGVDR